MGRSKGSGEINLEEKDAAQVAQSMKENMPDLVKGAMQVAPKNLFLELATDSILIENVLELHV